MMTSIIYRSAEDKTEELAQQYLQTHLAPHRYLAYRDIPSFVHQFVKGKRALDYGAGTGASSSFLHDLGLNVIGIDISYNMLKKAQNNFPYIQFMSVNELLPAANFDLVFSSFVLFELPCKDEIIQYLNKSFSFLKDGGIFIGITGSEHLYSASRNWMTFDANFEENRKLHSGDIAKLALKHPKMEFYDYYWKDEDYFNCFEKTGLEILQIHSPLGSLKETYPWKDELSYSPFTVFIAKKINSREPLTQPVTSI